MNRFEVETEWKHVSFDEQAAFVETYGFSGSQGAVNLEGIVFRPQGVDSRTLLIFMHPASTLQLLPIPRRLAEMGFHVLCAGSRYAKNDTALIMEKVLLDMGAYIRTAKERWGYDHVVIAGWSGGGSLGMFYQSQAESPTISATPSGELVDVVGAKLIPADAVIFQAAHLSRPRLLVDCIDPSVKDELNPDDRIIELDIYDVRNPNKPPYTKEFIEQYRAAQRARMNRITVRVKETLSDLNSRGTGERERGFVTHRTLADPRFLDKTLDPNGRPENWCYMGLPETANTGPVGLARFSMLRSWLSQWSLDDSRADGLSCVKQITVPLLAIENEADDAVPQPHTRMLFEAAGSTDKCFHIIEGANHYYKGQPELLDEAANLISDWLQERNLLGR